MDIQEVARLAKVSTATVSRVLNRSSKVRPITAKRVQRVIDELNYVPNTSARYLRAGRTKLFGLIVSDIKNPFFPELIDRFESLSANHGIDVVFTHTNYDLQRLDQCLRRMVERNVDGIAVMTTEVEVAALERVKRRKMPLVLLNQFELDKSFHNIHVDYSAGFEQAVQHLKALGHTRIGFLSGPVGLSSPQRRRAAFVAKMKESGLKVREELIAPGTMDVEGGIAAMQSLLTRSHRQTAVLCTNDMMALGAMQAAQKARLSIPRDLSIIGFDDLPICRMLTPRLTTIALPREEIAESAFSILLKASTPGSKVKIARHSIATELRIRESTGPQEG
jgi:DNA-binding LacI/PurR family transcriptional regulator